MSHQITTQIALHLKQVYFGGNWTTSNFKDQVSNVTWQEANLAIKEGNSIAKLLFHCNYYINGLIPVLQGGTLDIKDKFSFESPVITCEADWEQLKQKSWDEAELIASLIEKLPDSCLFDDFVEAKYGNYYRNFHGLIEHCHYHLGQIAIIKKEIKQ
ncbi:DUF1572 domain-containing protein [Flavobacterium sp. LM5]|uniref:DUF1572 domain-containing protein n=1 Tax=Flavobacterium sp. LM5 TaxID=1938610 RepID=UPI0009941542|nr:DUF1572 domain-containing protein [Flavobacterium sp. LM5]OOV26328.1 DUF1572 domain-containing protein [Flavobacterium sp. LM5]